MENITQNQKETNDHLIGIGKQLEVEKIESRSAFIFHKTEDGREFYKPEPEATWKELHLAEAGIVEAHTLTAIKDYLTENPDKLPLDDLIVRVCGPDSVRVESTLFGGWKQRECYMQTSAITPRHLFDSRVDPEEFVPYLQSCFCVNDDLDALIKIAGNIVDTSEVHLQDDGVSQNVTIRTGAARKAEVAVPSPAVLFPFSTFSEVEQPARKFVFRLGSSPLTCMLKECDGGAWRLTAVNSIASWLRDNLPEKVKVIA